MKIYTKTGDGGETGLFRGPRVPKHHVRVQAYGAVDELNAIIGIALSDVENVEIRAKRGSLADPIQLMYRPRNRDANDSDADQECSQAKSHRSHNGTNAMLLADTPAILPETGS